MPFFYSIDIWIVPVIIAALWSMWASAKVNSTFKKFSKMSNSRGLTGADCAMAVLRAGGVNDVRVERVSGNLTDHFDPKAKVIRLSDSVFAATSVAALGVAAHEAGHAVQHSVGYFPMKIRSAIIPATQLGSNLALPLVLLGILFSFPTLAYLGVAFFGLSSLFQLVTLPVEFNASNRALEALKDGGILVGNEITSAKKVLSAAAMTYVAALAVSLANLLRLFMMVNRNSRR
ncbi:MAG: zinc metallopeptidase [Clostridia bacterium]|nr:zinc metallopeptidase [Clostridia bacterium]